MLKDWSIRMRSLFRRAEVEGELDDELQYHIERQTEAYEKAGLSHDDAVRRTRIEFGGLDQAKEACRDARGVRLAEEVIQDLRFSARLLLKDRSFTAAVILVLSLGIGVTATVFTLVNAALIRDLPFEHPREVVSLGSHDTHRPAVRGPIGYEGISYQEYEEWRRSSTAFAGIAAYSDEATMNVSDDERAPERFRGAYVSGNAFSLLGQRPLLGRDFRPKDDRPGAPPVVILSYRLWVNRYGSDPGVVGQATRINAVPAVVVGVMPVRFGFPLTAEIWEPLAQMPGLLDQPREARVLNGVARLAPGTTIAGGRADLDSIADRMSKQFPDTDSDIRSTVWPYADRYIAPQVRLVVEALMGAVVFVLLIACANVANLLLARATQRSHEIATRVSLGATRSRIVRQLLSESVLLAAAGGAAGYGLSIVGARMLWSVLEANNPPYWLHLTTDVRTFGFLAALCLGTAILFGLAPALYASRIDAYGTIKHAPPTATRGFGMRKWMSALMIAEIALTLVLLAGAGFMVRSFFRLYTARSDVETSRLLTMRVDLPQATFRVPARRIRFVQRIEGQLRDLVPVTTSAITSAMPFARAPRQELSIEGRLPAGLGRPARVSVVAIAGGFFGALNLHLIRGREFADLDGAAGHEAAIVNQRFAATYFPGEDPIGHRIRLTRPEAATPAPWLTVVGVSPTVRQDVTIDGDPAVYVPYRAQPVARFALLVRTAGEVGAVVPLLREEVRALDPDLPLFDIKTMDERLALQRWPQRVFGTMFMMFACIGLMMAAVGLYAVTAYSVRRRTQEIGIRMALGARAPQVWLLVLRRVIVQLTAGLMVGLPGAFIVGRLPWMGSPDPLILLSIVLVVMTVAGVASFLPIWRATHLDPLRALRYE